MENNGIVTGLIPGGCNGLHKTYEESFFMYFYNNSRDKLFESPKEYGAYYLPETFEVLVLHKDDERINQCIRLEILNAGTLGSNNIVFELIDAKALHRHLVEEAYERQLMLQNNQKGL